MSHGITAVIETITPELARHYLTFNTHNRPLKPKKINGYARDILADDWFITGEAIKFDWDGTLLDGQNRLYGIIKAGKPTEILVVRGLDPRVMRVLDSGAPRSVRDALSLDGHKDAKSISAIIRTHSAWTDGLIRTANYQLSGAHSLTHSEALNYLEEHDYLVDVVASAKEISRQLRFPIGAVAVVMIETQTRDVEVSEEFFSRIREIRTSGTGDPIAALLKRSVSETTLARRNNAGTAVYLLVRTWNAFVSGEKITKFQLGSDAGGWTPIPRILSPREPDRDELPALRPVAI